MDTKIIKSLVDSSYKNDFLDIKKVFNIASVLNRSQLKQYINALKKNEREKNVVVTTPFNKNDERLFKKLFPNKKILFKKDKTLLLGARIVNNDNIYEFNLKNTIDKISSYITQNYD